MNEDPNKLLTFAEAIADVLSCAASKSSDQSMLTPDSISNTAWAIEDLVRQARLTIEKDYMKTIDNKMEAVS